MATVHHSFIADLFRQANVSGARMLLNQQRSSAECLLSLGGLEGNLQNSEQIFTENITQPSPDGKHDNQ